MSKWVDIINQQGFVWTTNTDAVIKNIGDKKPFDVASELHSAIFDCSSDTFSDYVDFVSRTISPYGLKNIAEYGCGNGALLYWYNRACNIDVYGYDISTALVDYCKQLFDTTHFKIPDDEFYNVDWHLCNSVLQYLDEHTATQLIKNMIANSNIGVFISDIKNANTQQLFYEKQMKRQGLSKAQLEEKYKDTPLQFYSKDFFAQFGKVSYYDMPASYPDSDLKSFAVKIRLDS